MDFEAAVSTVNEGLDGLSGADVAALTDGELSDAVVELERLKARLDATEATVVGAWDRRRVWASDGARSGAAWLVWRCRMARSRASRLLRRARHLREMPEAPAALEQGEISGDHVDALGRVRRDDVAGAFERDEADLVTNARRLRFDHFAKTGAGASRLRVCAFGPGSPRSDAHAFAGQWHRGSQMDCVSI